MKKLKKLLSSAITCALLVTTLAVPSTKPAKAAENYNYGEALQKSLMFYELQRSGKLPADKRDNWRGDSGLTDGADAGLDLTGGLYDAGDHVKFNLPMAYTATMLSWSVYESRAAYEKSGQLQYILGDIKWITDYLIKCHPSPNEYYYQVGDGGLDHSWWGPAEVMQMSRPSYKLDLSKPGSAVSGEAAAALAAASIIFKDTNPTYSALCLRHAKELFNFADTTRSDAGYTAAQGYYNSWSGFWDELSWAATWIYMATSDSAYLAKAESYVPNWEKEGQSTDIKYKWTLNWDAKHYGAQLLLARITNKAIYKESAERNLDWWTTGYNGSRITYTPNGLAWLDTWGSLRYATTEAFLASVYSDWSGCTPSKAATYKNFAKQQVDYALGSTGRSYMVGFGVNSPKHPHHRTAHSSWADSQTVPDYHRHTLYGAMVGGPDSSDGYTDDISNFQTNEVACDYNAGLTGALVKLYNQYGGNPIADFNAIEQKTNDEFFVEAGINASGPNFLEVKALLNNRSGWPARMGDKLSFKYFIDISEWVNAGYSASSITTNTNYNNGAVVSQLIPWDASKNIYYVNVDFTGTKIYPGGQSAYKKEVQFRIAGPQNTTIWNNANDFSYNGISTSGSGSTAKAVNIPVYDNGVKVFGNEPGQVIPGDNSAITPTTAAFDKNVTNQADIPVSMTLNGNTLVGIYNGSSLLTAGSDYTVSGSTVTVTRAYLATQPVGTTQLKFDFSAGVDPILSIAVTDSTPQNVAAPTFGIPGGTYNTAQTVSLNCATTGATIRYTTDGTIPTSTSSVYSGSITVSSSTTIKAYAVKSGMTNSDVVSATYTISPVTQQVAAPTFSIPEGTYNTAQTVSLNCATTGAVIRYTVDGTIPTSSSPVYSSPITVTETTTIKAYTVKSGMTDSNVVSAAYTISTTPQSPVVVTYTIVNDWGTGATINVTIKNNGTSAINGWTLAWAFPSNQSISNMWSATNSISGSTISCRNMDYNAVIAANGGTQTFGFNINYSGANVKPTSFTLNGTAYQVQ